VVRNNYIRVLSAPRRLLRWSSLDIPNRVRPASITARAVRSLVSRSAAASTRPIRLSSRTASNILGFPVRQDVKLPSLWHPNMLLISRCCISTRPTTSWLLDHKESQPRWLPSDVPTPPLGVIVNCLTVLAKRASSLHRQRELKYRMSPAFD
jgi:hypothetical protein